MAGPGAAFRTTLRDGPITLAPTRIGLAPWVRVPLPAAGALRPSCASHSAPPTRRRTSSGKSLKLEDRGLKFQTERMQCRELRKF
jgi:hypothetical protein